MNKLIDQYYHSLIPTATGFEAGPDTQRIVELMQDKGKTNGRT